MSLKTRRLSASAVAVERFAWSPTETGGRVASGTAGSDVWAPVDVPAPARTARPQAQAQPGASSPTSLDPFQPTPEQQAQLAALERDAFTKGYAQGERAGLEAGGKRAEAMLRRLAQTLEELSGLRDNMVRQTERELVQLSIAIARRVLHREVTVDPELTAALAHIALERLGGPTPATVRLHPDDYAIVTSGQVTPLSARQVEIRPDPSVARGGCLVESEFGFINASVDAQVDEIARAVLGEPIPAGTARRGVA
jgi:flagellar assembly protein FliH